MKKVAHDASTNPFNTPSMGNGQGGGGPEDIFKDNNFPPLTPNSRPTPKPPHQGGGMQFADTPTPTNGAEGLYDDFQNFEQQQQQPRQSQTPPRNPQPQQEPTYQEDEESNYDGNNGGYQQYTQPGTGGAAIKFAGVIAIVIIIVIAYKFISSGNKSRKNEIEAFVKANPTGGFIDATKGNNSNPNVYDNPVEGDYLEEDLSTAVVTEIVKFNKKLSEDGRTMISVESENYGVYEIHVPHYRYQELDDKGYLLVDMEIIGNKLTFLYISQKQENLTEILNNEGK